MYQRGVIHLLPLLIVVVVVVVGIYLVVQGTIKLPSVPLLQKKPKVELKTSYENPFNKDTQYVNPFEKSKNPFVTGR